MNYSDTERLSRALENLGYSLVKEENKADLILFNTCSVRKSAEDRVYARIKKISKMKRERPNLLVGVTGCMVRKNNITLRRKKDVDFTFQIKDLPNLPQLISEANEEFDVESYFHIPPKRDSKHQVWVPIQTGCDKFCTYCIVPFSRGREQSRPMDDIVKECEKAVEEGAIEITLLGQTVDSYGLSVQDKRSEKFSTRIPNVIFNSKIFQGKNEMASAPDAPKGERPFITLLRRIDALKEQGLKRLRYTSPHPQDFSEDLIKLHTELDTLQPWIHLPVQAGSNRILELMRRTYTREHYLHLIELIRKHIPDCAISTDIIVGFPGETKEEFEESYNLMKEIDCDMAFMAQYSPRPGTHSADQLEDDVPHKEKTRRFHALNDLLTKISRRKHEAFVGQTVEVLVEKCTHDKKTGLMRCSGRTPHYKEVFFDAPKGEDLIGQLVNMKVEKASEFFLEGQGCKNIDYMV